MTMALALESVPASASVRPAAPPDARLRARAPARRAETAAMPVLRKPDRTRVPATSRWLARQTARDLRRRRRSRWGRLGRSARFPLYPAVRGRVADGCGHRVRRAHWADVLLRLPARRCDWAVQRSAAAGRCAAVPRRAARPAGNRPARYPDGVPVRRCDSRHAAGRAADRAVRRGARRDFGPDCDHDHDRGRDRRRSRFDGDPVGHRVAAAGRAAFPWPAAAAGRRRRSCAFQTAICRSAPARPIAGSAPRQPEPAPAPLRAPASPAQPTSAECWVRAVRRRAASCRGCRCLNPRCWADPPVDS